MTRRPSRRATAIRLLAPLLGVAVLGSACGTSDGSGRSAEGTGIRAAVDRTCADLVVLGARGSTQDPDLNAGVGTEVRVTLEALATRLARRSDISTHVEAIRYDASATSTLDAYTRNTARGAQMMVDRLRSLATSCPDSRFALVGFSQGAQVVHAAALDVPASAARRVSLVAMIADPRNNPADAITRWSYSGSPTTGSGRLGSGTPIPPTLRAAAIALCVAGDEICNDRGAPGGPPSSTHRHFYEKPAHAELTAEQLDRVLRSNGV